MSDLALGRSIHGAPHTGSVSNRAAANAPAPDPFLKEERYKGHTADRARGFTLIEIMVATVITLMLMGSVAAMFGFVSTSVSDSRAMAEASERLRNARNLLQHDLQGITAYGTPPLNPSQSRGYLEYIEGPQGVIWRAGNNNASPGAGGNATQLTGTTLVESVWDDCDDILMFTTRSVGEPYIGRFYDVYAHDTMLSSPTAEVAWFVRGTTLFRRVLLVLPNQNLNLIGNLTVPYYAADISMRQVGGSLSTQLPSLGAPINAKLAGNSLSDLTNRENRYAHQPMAWPYDVRFWNWLETSSGSGASMQGTGAMYSSYGGYPNLLGLPTLQECSSSAFPFPLYGPEAPAYVGTSRVSSQYAPTLFGNYVLPFPSTSYPSKLGKNANQSAYPSHWGLYPYTSAVGGVANPDPVLMINEQNALNRFYQTSSMGLLNNHSSTGTSPPRFDDVVMTGVVGFDVKIWDPGAPVFQMNATVGGLPAATSVAPGDPYYYQALAQFNSNATPGSGPYYATLGSVGAYVDLSYMTAPTTGSVGVALGQTNYFSTYLTKLNTYESNVKATTAGISGDTTTYPAYIIPRPRFAAEGDLPVIVGSTAAGSTVGPAYAYPGCPPIMRGWMTSATSGGVKMTTANYTGATSSVFDTWSTAYESDGVDQDQDGTIDEGTDGIDNPYYGTSPFNHPANSTGYYIGGVDDPSELEAAPPYATACKGLQIRIRVLEPGSRQIREVTVIQELLDE